MEVIAKVDRESPIFLAGEDISILVGVILLRHPKSATYQSLGLCAEQISGRSRLVGLGMCSAPL